MIWFRVTVQLLEQSRRGVNEELGCLSRTDCQGGYVVCRDS